MVNTLNQGQQIQNRRYASNQAEVAATFSAIWGKNPLGNTLKSNPPLPPKAEKPEKRGDCVMPAVLTLLSPGDREAISIDIQHITV